MYKIRKKLKDNNGRRDKCKTIEIKDGAYIGDVYVYFTYLIQCVLLFLGIGFGSWKDEQMMLC